MKAISIRNPYAHFIMCGEKTIEVRTWQTDYRGEIVICSSANPKIKNTISGYALCVAKLDNIEPLTKEHLHDACMAEMPEKKAFAWHLSDVRVIKPFKVKGKLNLFDIDDNLIEVLDNEDGTLTDEEIEQRVNEYITPLLYKGK